MSRGSFLEQVTVSRETLAHLDTYAALLTTWQPRINLVSNSTLPDMWRRHFLDSAQLHPHIPAGSRVLDLGAGAGFPGLVLAMLGGVTVTLVESDNRKCTFMREVIRHTRIPAQVINKRIESAEMSDCDVITSRALAPLDRLLELVEPYLTEKTQCLFLKGNKFKEELTIANQSWNIVYETFPSCTDPSGCIVKISSARRKQEIEDTHD